MTDAAAAAGCVGHCDDNLSVRGARSYHAPSVIRKYGEWQQKQTVNNSAVKGSIGSITGFHNHGEGPYQGLLLVESAY